MSTATTTEPTAGDLFSDMPHHRAGKQRYSLLRACRRIRDGHRLDGLEGEVHAELARRTGRSARGILLPLDLALPMPMERRALTTATGSGSIAYDVPRTTLLDALRSRLVISALGGQIKNFSDGPGPLQIPFKSAAAATSWVGESGSAGASTSMTTAATIFQPKTCTAFTDLTRIMLDYRGAEIENFALEDLAASIAHAIDAAALNGPGNNSQPLGFFQHAGIPVVPIASDSGNGGLVAYGDVVALEAAVGVANGDGAADASTGFVTSPQGRSALRRVDIGTNSGRKLWTCRDGVDTVIGKKAYATTGVPAAITKGTGTSLTALGYGNWRDCMINLFSVVDLLVDTSRLSQIGAIRLNAYQDVDIQYVRAQSFAVLNAVSAA